MAVTFSLGKPAGSTQPTAEQTQGSQDKTGSSSGQQTGNQSNSGTSVKTSNSSQGVNVANMSSDSLKALNALIQQLQGGQPLVDRAQAEAAVTAKGFRKPDAQMIDSRGKGYKGGQFDFSTPILMQDPDYMNSTAYRNWDAMVQAEMANGGVSAPGTAETQRQSQQIQGEITRLQTGREGYTKDAAFADAKGAEAQLLRQVMEQFLPGINNAEEGSGMSGGATAALLKGDLATRAAESAAALGLKAAVDYGGVFDQQSKTIGGLVANSTPILDKLLAALGVAKGSVEMGSRTTAGTETTNNDQSQLSQQNSNLNNTENTNTGTTKVSSGSQNTLGEALKALTMSNPFSNYAF